MSAAFTVDSQALDVAPNHWTRAPLWSVLRRRDISERPDAELLSVYRDHGVVPKASRDDNFNKPSEDLNAYRFVRPGDLVLNKMKTWQGSLAVSQYEGIVSPAYFVCELSPKLHPRFVHYLLRSQPYVHLYQSVSKGIRPNQWDLPFDEFRSLPMLLPPLEEQRRIADFLDAETSHIDRMIGYRRQQIEATLALEQSLLAEHIGDVSAGSIRVKFLVSRLTSGPRGWGEFVTDDGTVFLRIANIPRVGIDLDTRDILRVCAPEGPERERTRTRPGDVLVSITADIGSVAVVSDEMADGNVSQHIALLRPVAEKCYGRWLAYALKSPRSRQQLAANSYGGTKVGLGLAEVGNVGVPAMAFREQQDVVRKIDTGMHSSIQLKSAMKLQNSLLAERRQALIAAAVTGQFDVTTASGRNVTQGV
ncbi:restriction endonuclease subunit S [Nocardia suismassiliense]|uniref:restriction endonuclease subunit S n=1 Tax=Nocardia suismassiliense TaxID=2077092 RepID=UPI00131F2B4E|nr:hypothetical protein [Nocardia suismassiliense]